jgi:deazaflavin-dependent oxidoreductase (nitroreductase family)
MTYRRFHPIHTRLYRWSGGRGPVGRALGVDMILLAVRGRRSGEPRTVPLVAVRDGASWLVVGSNAGKEWTPGWVHDLRLGPAVDVTHRRTVVSHAAREAAPHEYERLWAAVATAYPGFEVYRGRTARAVPIFVLDPIPAD